MLFPRQHSAQVETFCDLTKPGLRPSSQIPNKQPPGIPLRVHYILCFVIENSTLNLKLVAYIIVAYGVLSPRPILARSHQVRIPKSFNFLPTAEAAKRKSLSSLQEAMRVGEEAGLPAQIFTLNPEPQTLNPSLVFRVFRVRIPSSASGLFPKP